MSAASDLASPGPSAELSAGAADAQFLRLVGQHRPLGPHKHFNSIPVLVALSRRSAIKREADEEQQEEGSDGSSRDRTVELEGESGGGGATDAEIATLDGHIIRLRLDELYDVKGLEELEEAATRTQFGLRSESASPSSSPEADHETSGMSRRNTSWKHPRFGSGILRLAGVGGRSRTSTASGAVEGDAGGSARAQTPLGHSLLPSIIAKGSRHEFGLPFDDGFDDLVHARRLVSAESKHNVSSDDELSDIDPDREYKREENDEGDDAKADAEQQEEDDEEGGEVREAQEKPRRTRGSTQRSSKRRKTEKEAADGDGDHEETNAAEEEEEEQQDEDEDEQNEEVDDDEEEEEEEEEDEAQSTRSGRRGGQSSAEHNSRKRTRSNRSSTAAAAAAQPASASKAGTKKKGQSDASGSSLAVEQGQPSKSTRSSTAPRRSTRR
ncbi:hypothetical protein IE81DRAFT_324094 [Ceraceosorus guamensis]|uniref:Uncharacterized protein n=1 Tax=Ceraceosorus guamensis TaxID=1522189 RepID=A0A316VX81_9BASI|nr:hypothetical protein IE81DRAFT_324094 [Ceraceosorus guamensis]PWN41914.1 hypothetical protein IE81DRAFT_324094 [Ceraceosorus guamensis]